jgi:hypothetical protein
MEEKKRLVIMNRQCIWQTVGDDGKWRDSKIERARERPPGIYNLHLAASADPAQTYGGPVMYVDASHVYQGFSKAALVRHAVEKFQKVPDLGAVLVISYGPEGQAVVAPMPVRARR